MATYLEQAKQMLEEDGGKDKQTATAVRLLLDFSEAKSLQTIADCLVFLCDHVRNTNQGIY